jgi:molybdate transport system permease protein
MIRRGPFAAGAALAAVALFVFLVLPVVAVFTNVGLGKLTSSIADASSRQALWLSLRTTAIAVTVVVVVGAPAAFVLARSHFRGRAAVLTLIELPLVMPPAVAGIALLAAFGPGGLLGPQLSGAGLQLVFETAGVVVALAFVSAPFFMRQAIAAFAMVEDRQLEAAASLGAGPARAFATVAIPAAREGLVAGIGLAWARALGEFGATLLFAGSLPGVTRTAPLQIFADFSRPNGFTEALALSAVLIALAAAILLVVKLLGTERPAPRVAP